MFVKMLILIHDKVLRVYPPSLDELVQKNCDNYLTKNGVINFTKNNVKFITLKEVNSDLIHQGNRDKKFGWDNFIFTGKA